MLFILCIFVSLSFHYTFAGYIEKVTVSGCESCKLYLTCRHLTSIIVILEADFIPNYNGTSLNSSFAPTPFPRIPPRQALNRRCSGVNHCSFILTEDCPAADTWGAGNLTIKYACVTEDRIRTYCNSEIVLPAIQDSGTSEGFIHNPGYPRFYSSERECRWKIRASPQQRIQITILDIALTADHTILPDECTDRLEFVDSSQIIHSTCKLQEPPLQIVSRGERLDIVLASRHSLIPLRGVLVHYVAVGCPTPPTPEDGYLLYRNDTVAEFRCCVGFAFPDDGLRTRVLTCLGAFWDLALPLPDCKRKPLESIPGEKILQKPLKEDMTSELIMPSVLIAALFLINFLVIFYIYRIKQKHVIEYADEELGTFSNREMSTK